MEDTILVSYVKSTDDAVPVLVVGRKKPLNEAINIINAFQGEEATRLYNKLITKNTDNK